MSRTTETQVPQGVGVLDDHGPDGGRDDKQHGEWPCTVPSALEQPHRENRDAPNSGWKRCAAAGRRGLPLLDAVRHQAPERAAIVAAIEPGTLERPNAPPPCAWTGRWRRWKATAPAAPAQSEEA
jgi:hypothetical protein